MSELQLSWGDQGVLYVFRDAAVLIGESGGLVQRGDAEMAQKLWRVVRACVDLGAANPIEQIHDQGAGGNCNVVRHPSLQLIMPQGFKHALLMCLANDTKTCSECQQWW